MEFDDLSLYTEAEIEALETFRFLLSHTVQHPTISGQNWNLSQGVNFCQHIVAFLEPASGLIDK